MSPKTSANTSEKLEGAAEAAHAPLPAYGIMTKAIIGLPLLAVGEHLVGLARFLKLLLATSSPGFRSG